jgi:FkbM family methyltransferase
VKKLLGLRRTISALLNKPLGCFGYEIRTIPLTKRNKYLWLKDSNICTVIDIGANVGQFARDILKAFPDVQVYSFEPLQDCYSEIRKLCRHYENWEAFPFALGEKEERVEMFRSGFAPSSSLLKMTGRHKELFPHTANISSETVNIKRLDDVARALNLKEEVLVKIDVQGFEDRVIRGGQNTLRRAKVILTEVSFEKLYEGQSDFHTVYNLLYQLGFQFAGFEDQLRDPQTSVPIQADAIFTRRW